MTLALEVSDLLHSRIAERASAKEEIRLAKAEVESQTQKLEKEKHELQSELEKELDRRSSDWLLKLEKYSLEEQRLRERVRELAELNVSLQREVSSSNERETGSINMISYSEQKHSRLLSTIDGIGEKNHDLQQNLIELQEKYVAVKEDRDCIKRNFEVKEKECKELHISITRLLRTCHEQEKTINGLRERFSKELDENQPAEKFDKQLAILKMERMRLTGVELALRRELESCRAEVKSLRQENVNILNQLKENRNGSDALTLKLEKEMWTRINCLQNQGLSLLNESSQFCSKLLEFIKKKAGQPEINEGMETVKNGLEGEFLIESQIRVQGLKRGTERLTRNLQMVSTLLHEKSDPAALKIHSQGMDANRSEKLNDQYSKMLKKDEIINHLQNDLQESKKELAIGRGILPMISKERDQMWEEMKQYTERNTKLNSEVNVLKKKIEALDEETLLKEGQISILKESLEKNPFDYLLADPDSTREFLLR